MANTADRIKSCELVARAIELMLSEDGELAEVEAHLSKALDLWAENLDALEETAHFYDAVMPDSQKAKHYAALSRARALELTAAMDDILKDSGLDEPQ